MKDTGTPDTAGRVERLLGGGAHLELDPTDPSVLDPVPLDAGIVLLGLRTPHASLSG